MIFSLIALLSVWGGNSVDRAAKGEDGGLVGWGLARMSDLLLPGPLNTLLWLGLLVITTIAAFWPIRRIVIQTVANNFQATELRKRKHEEPASMDKVEPVAHSLSSLAELLKNDNQKKKEEPGTMDVTRSLEKDRPKTDRLPPINLLSQEQTEKPDPQIIHQLAEQIEITLTEFGVPSTVTGYRIGPTVTQFAVEPGFIEKVGIDGNITRQKIRVAQIAALSRDLALALKAKR